jgi:hypothetical protein
MKTTHREIINFINSAGVWLATNNEETKFSYALNRVIKRAETIHRKFQDQREDLQLEHCMVDEKGKVLRATPSPGNPQGGYEFTKDGLLKLNKAVRALLDTEVEIEPYIATAHPVTDKNCPHCKKLVERNGLSELERDAFMGFVIKGKRED